MAVSQRRINAGSVYACHTRLTGASKLLFTSTSRSDGVLTSAGFISFAPLVKEKFNCRLVVPTVFRNKPFGESVEGPSHLHERRSCSHCFDDLASRNSLIIGMIVCPRNISAT